MLNEDLVIHLSTSESEESEDDCRVEISDPEGPEDDGARPGRRRRKVNYADTILNAAEKKTSRKRKRAQGHLKRVDVKEGAKKLLTRTATNEEDAPTTAFFLKGVYPQHFQSLEDNAGPRYRRDHVKVGQCYEIRQTKKDTQSPDAKHLARVTELGKDGVRIVWFYSPEHTPLSPSAGGLLAKFRKGLILASAHCECRNRWVGYNELIDLVKVSYSSEPKEGYDYYCPLFFDEDNLNTFMPIDFVKYAKPSERPENLCGCVVKPGGKRSEIPNGFDYDETCEGAQEAAEEEARRARSIYQTKMRSFKAGQCYGLRTKGERLETVVEVISVMTGTKSPHIVVRPFLRPKSSYKNEVAYANLAWSREKLRIDGWDEIDVRFNFEVFVEYWDGEGDMPLHLRHHGATRNFFFRNAPETEYRYPSKNPAANPNKMRPLRALSLMGGAGNFEIGLEESGFCAVEKMVDLDADAVKSYNARMRRRGKPEGGECIEATKFLERCRQNRQEHKHKYEVIVGGLCCTSWSLLNRSAHEDDRGTILKIVGMYAEFFNPYYFVMENVAEFGRHKKFKEVDIPPYLYMVAQMLGLATGYPLPRTPMYTNYAQVPDGIYYSNFFLRCHRKREDFDEEEAVREAAFKPFLSAPCEPVTIRDAIGHLPALPPYGRAGAAGLKHHERSNAATAKFERLKWEGFFDTITGTLRENARVVHPDVAQDRHISVRECALAQGFEPEDIDVLVGDKASVQKQIGNAVPASMAFAVGTEIVRCIRPYKLKERKGKWERGPLVSDGGPHVPAEVEVIEVTGDEEEEEEECGRSGELMIILNEDEDVIN
ncbi:hypothetical protein HK101_010673 [Irineochytrium annulatum]|nr:hypothetical protein HK101_010673 [Irineochytrium annulatum]